MFDISTGEEVKAATPPVSASVLLTSGDVFQSQTPDLCKFGSACRTQLDTLSALAACGVAVGTQLYGRHQVLPANWTLQFLQQIFIHSKWQIIHI
jgi:hypothetical protein